MSIELHEETNPPSISFLRVIPVTVIEVQLLMAGTFVYLVKLVLLSLVPAFKLSPPLVNEVPSHFSSGGVWPQEILEHTVPFPK